LSDTPLTDAIRSYRAGVLSRLHVPAHGGGPGNPELEQLWPGLLAWDVTEQPDLDDLSHPDGPIRASQALARDFFGAAEAFYLTGGATLGVQAAILAATGRGGALLVARDAHRSVLGACLATDAELVLLDPRRDAVSGASLGPSPDEVLAALRRWPDIRAVLVNYPSYLGIAPDLAGIAAAAHDQGAVVIADAAHGAHFGLHPDLPPAALGLGADIVVLGMHKTGGALTQSAMLLLAPGALALRDDVRRALGLLGTSSPSYLLLVSLEQAVHALRRAIPDRLAGAIAAAQAVGGTARIQTDRPQDPLRIAWRAEKAAEIVDALALQGVRGEYVDGETALYCVHFGAGPSDLAPLRAVLEDLGAPPAARAADRREPRRARPQGALLAARRQVPLLEAVGSVAAEVVAPVPPGIPVLWPGEEVTAEAARELRLRLGGGQRIMGIDQQKVWVVAE